MKDEFRLLTCKGKGLSHQPTEVSINWEGMDVEGLRHLARSAIIYALQCAWKKSSEAIPEAVKVKASDFIRGPLHDTLLADLEDRPQPKKINWLDQLVAGMNELERAKLLKELSE